jgi:hypothetical protein
MVSVVTDFLTPGDELRWNFGILFKTISKFDIVAVVSPALALPR